jgi:4-alpha-glucanotransferase
MTGTAASASTLLRKVARLWGILPEFIDAKEERKKSPPETLRLLLELLSSLPAQSDDDLLRLREEAWLRHMRQPLAPVLVSKQGTDLNLRLYVPADLEGESVRIELDPEAGPVEKEEIFLDSPDRRYRFGNERFLRFRQPLRLTSPLGAGYHRLRVEGRGFEAQALLLVKPRPQPRATPSPKTWGLFAPLYALRSSRNWGIGDFTDLAEFQKKVKEKGGRFVGTLPLLAVNPLKDGADPSPYSPLSKLFWNEIFLDVERLIEKEKAFELKEKVGSAGFQARLRELRQSDQVDYAAVFALKKEMLLALARHFFKEGGAESREYHDFLARRPWVREFALFRADDDEAEKRYHLYCQFRLDEELSRLKGRARRGEIAQLYLDFPVGVRKGGFDESLFPSAFLKRCSAGAPPDLVFHEGQDWGFAPLHPLALRRDGYRYLIESLRTHMLYAGLLRVDHVMGFHRIYVIPEGLCAKKGAYLRFHREELFAILQIEAARAGVRVIGEDLGTVPPVVREALADSGGYRMWILPFEAGRSPHRSFAKAPTHSLMGFNTHDMVPFAGFRQGIDIDLYERLHLFTSGEAERERRDRKKLVKAWMSSLGLRSEADLFSELLDEMIHSPAELLMINTEDLWDETLPQNIPGTWKEYPNWRKKLAFSLDDIFANPVLKTRLQHLKEGRP